MSTAAATRAAPAAPALDIERDARVFAQLIVDEAGKTLVQAQKEVKRCVNTLKLSAEEAKRNAGEVVPFDAYEGSESRQGWFTREPLGLILAITPYNDPLNLVAHKLGPALAARGRAMANRPDINKQSVAGAISTVVLAGLVAFHAVRGGRASAERARGLTANPIARPSSARARATPAKPISNTGRRPRFSATMPQPGAETIGASAPRLSSAPVCRSAKPMRRPSGGNTTAEAQGLLKATAVEFGL